MNPKVQAILDALHGDGFPYPVAIYPDRDFDIGPFLSVDAFDVPDADLVPVCDRISELLAPIKTEPEMLTGAFYEGDSALQRERLPDETVWYLPRRTHAQTR